MCVCACVCWPTCSAAVAACKPRLSACQSHAICLEFEATQRVVRKPNSIAFSVFRRGFCFRFCFRSPLPLQQCSCVRACGKRKITYNTHTHRHTLTCSIKSRLCKSKAALWLLLVVVVVDSDNCSATPPPLPLPLNTFTHTHIEQH